jgi:hypothetical protein
MSDLQCPATILLIARESIAFDGGPALVEGRHLSGVFVAPAVAADPGGLAAAGWADANAAHLSTMPDVDDAASLAQAIEDLADLHRGETIAVVATRAMIEEVLGETRVRAGVVAIAVDDSGWSFQ